MAKEAEGKPMRRCGDGVIADWTINDVATLHDNGKEWEELERSGASICDLRPSENEDKIGHGQES